ncbi:Di-and tricarboxylate transporter [Gracilibacillus ureilyticus]|uniref:Di-and tricarboxylate transporter n=1 Tax=Gracilibacillus ureilyticus TaxID=531814 RepID=A0A1H9VBL3_9BACI|nr:SLC13 family permease [Gracilibacillus ureilyticus]SES18921.1 Di-and tricarboxylate transporter [Gracilibacillus ureilyticus]
MNWEIIFVLTIVILMMVALIKEVTRPDMIVFGTLTIFLITGILTPEEAVAGFSNQGMLTVALLFIIAGAIQKSGLVDRGMARVLGKPKSQQRALLKLLVPISGFSAFLNNTPIVVTLTPIIRKWCKEHNISPSKFLIPLSYASILGGILTLMGTSTNLVVHGLMLDRGMEGYSLFTLAMVSLPASVLGLIYLVTIGYKILPNHKGLTESFSEKSKEYLIEVIIEENYPFLDNPYVGKTVEEAGLRNLEGLYLIEIVRRNEKIYPVKNSTKIKSNDHLIFTGVIDKIAELQNKKGLKIKTGTNLSLDKLNNGTGQLVEVVVSHQSSLLHQTIKETQFRAKFDAGVIAVHRNNERIISKIGDIALKPGDTLLLLTGGDFYERASSTNDFYVVTQLEEDHPLLNKLDGKKSWFSIITLISMILLVSLDVLSMFKAMSLTVILYFVFKIISPDEAKKNIQFNVLLLIASAFGVGEALFKTGAADWVANKVISLADPFGMIGVLIFLYVLTVVFTEMITNNAAAVLMFPVAVEAANRLSVDPMAFLVLITIGASASFLSPIGYQTNLIVYGPGGYKFSDYIKVGLPLSLIMMVTTIIMVNIIWIN